MSVEKASKYLAWAMLAAAICFVPYLAYGPNDSTAQSWLTNLGLAIVGIAFSVLWLLRRSSRGLVMWSAIVGAVLFIGIFLVVVIPANSETIADWIPDKMGWIRKMASIGAWSFVLAEIHRVLSLALAIVSLVIMIVIVVRGDKDHRPIEA
jgi:hypothetical protein